MKTFKTTLFVRAETDTDAEELFAEGCPMENTAVSISNFNDVSGCQMLKGEEKTKCEEIDEP